MISEDRQMLLKAKNLSDTNKKLVGDRLDEWTVSRIESYYAREFSVGDFNVTDLDGLTDEIQMDNLYLYYYLLGMPLYLKKRTPEEREKSGYPVIVGEVRIRDYKWNGKPFGILCLINEDEYNELYKDIVIEE